MIFSSLSFLTMFLPITLFVYYIVSERARPYVLVGASLFFYAWGDVAYVPGLCLLIFLHYLFAKRIGSADETKRKKLLVQGIVIDLLLLIYFKYYGSLLGLFFSSTQYTMPSMPLGLSFILFTSMSYLIDVYRAEAGPGSLLDTALYISFFPKLIMGPIEPYHRFSKQLTKRTISMESIDQGAKWFVLGLAQKVILADTFQMLYAQISAIPDTLLTSWQKAFTYTFQIYFDFQGYSMMAIGLAGMLGFTLMKNFDDPYTAHSIQDFWRRWHRSLSQWFRDYVYIPLGGNRVSTRCYIRNIFIVWALTGLWHGSTLNFLLWGLYYGCLLLLEKYVGKTYQETAPLWLRKSITFLCVMFGWVIFANPDLSQMMGQFSSMFHLNGTPFYEDISIFYFLQSIGYIVLAIVCIMPGWRHALTTCISRLPYASVIRPILYLLLFILSICFIVSSGFQSFLYVQF